MSARTNQSVDSDNGQCACCVCRNAIAGGSSISNRLGRFVDRENSFNWKRTSCSGKQHGPVNRESPSFISNGKQR
ncbi:hypothetical protein JCM19232_2631 [Vibrio ishigakensis]|uniref:Uncharacterized protein n=1 Tax=Vibrio ishigakensis TaxID=1481914 RepID=A0A0B8PB93_9VIBR|nr:hypothetical protein JCM19232_2631 [Vibrio ishigakensis]